MSDIHPSPKPTLNAPVIEKRGLRPASLLTVGALFWSAGLLFFTVRIFGRNLRFRHRLGTIREITEPETLALFANCKSRMGVTARIRLSETNVIKGPALHGFFRVWLLLPAGMIRQFSAAELSHIFLHELAHVKRRDMGVLWLMSFCETLHWFNPLLWFGFRRMAADREFACDEMVLACEGEGERRGYGETILKLLESCAVPARVPGLVGILEDKAQIRRRILLIANFKQRPHRPIIAWVFAVTASLATLTDAQSERPDAAKPQPNISAVMPGAKMTNTIQDYEATISAYEKNRHQAAVAVFRLGESYRQLGKLAEANAQFQRILTEFPEETGLTGPSQQYLLGLPNPPPAYALSINDVIYPGGVAVDATGNVYVSDTRNNRIRKFTSRGDALAQWGGAGNDPGSFNYPQGLATDSSNNLYVADVHNQRIQKFLPDGTFVTQWGELGSEPGKFSSPYNVAVDKAGNVYVADSRNNRIQKFTGSGVFLKEIGTLGRSLGQLQEPQGVAVDASGNIYVGDGGNGRIQKFNADGAALAEWPCSNHDVAVDAQGHVYVVAFDCIKMFSSAGELLTQWGSKGAGKGQFDFAARVAVNPAGSRVFVTDAENNRVQVFDYPSTAR
jgi:beta-lactamase regulating signal transducer with metallopeptidase domain/DNA-binding beta-propeller fold protein YncE